MTKNTLKAGAVALIAAAWIAAGLALGSVDDHAGDDCTGTPSPCTGTLWP